MLHYEPDLRLARDVHLFGPGPKRVLALDGGGVRGIMSLAYLERLEALLAERSDAGADFRLSDYFDLIGGTSTGAIIATGLALGFGVTELVDVYCNVAKKAFKGSRWHKGLLWPKFRSKPLLELVHGYVGEETLGSERLLTGLAIIAKRLDTDSVWVFHNNPRGRFYDVGSGSDSVPNRDLPLANLIRASTAAPTYFEPEFIEIAPGIAGAFVDGAVSPHSNPALLMLMLATVRGYGLSWPLGADRLMLTSVGTGYDPIDVEPHALERLPSSVLAVMSLRSILGDSNFVAQAILQWLSRCPQPWPIDAEMGDLSDDRLGAEPLLHYQRYDVILTEEWLGKNVGVTLAPGEIARLGEFDDPSMVDRLLEIGRSAAEAQLDPAHFPSDFDVAARR